jgi:hypothetical protein
LIVAHANEFNIPASDLKSALDAYAKQAGVALMYPDDEVRGAYSKGAKGDLSADVALSRILSGTGFKIRRDPSGALGVVHDDHLRDNSRLVTTPMLYDKNGFNETAITGAFLNSDDTGLTTNIFLTDPKLIGIRVTKNW